MTSQFDYSTFDPSGLTIPLFVGTVVNFLLLGALAVQTYIYFVAFPNDLRQNKLVVTFILFVEILQTLGNAHDTVISLGSRWGDVDALDKVGWAWLSVPVLGGLLGCVGQLFFAWRIHIIGGRRVWVVPVIISAITLFQFAAGVYTGVQITAAHRFSNLSFDSMQMTVAWLAATAFSDLLIVAAMVYYLLQARQPGFNSATEAAVNRIIAITIETGIPCAVFALADLAIFVQTRGNTYHLGICIWLCKVYSNSILAILNSRAHIGHPAALTDSSTAVTFNSSSSMSQHRRSRYPQLNPHGITITQSRMQFASCESPSSGTVADTLKSFRGKDLPLEPVYLFGSDTPSRRTPDLEKALPVVEGDGI
ncbi:hypothetical protein MKEN_00304600 [Mycena kentingensis (nom. inval.)]|nr:hypothetical protein MKEN_00304600 [Mycena kentingensis (nom. inval.)]